MYPKLNKSAIRSLRWPIFPTVQALAAALAGDLAVALVQAKGPGAAQVLAEVAAAAYTVLVMA
jgi:hypothetical protein